MNNIFQSQKGNFVEKSTGKILGAHDGFWQFTIGQRKGIGLAAPEALYVTGIDSATNTVYVGYKKDLMANDLHLDTLHWSYPQKKEEFEALVKIRYNMNSVPAKIIYKDSAQIIFKEPISAIAKGQACVIYDKNDGHLIGGGMI